VSAAFDVIVIGYGLAGAVSAIEAHDAGAKVLLIEKESLAGGISICAGGGARIADDAGKAFTYLKASNAGTTPEPVLMALAQGMVELPAYVRALCRPLGAVAQDSTTKGNYALPGYETWGYVRVEHVPGFDPARDYPHVRAEGEVEGRNMFKVAQANVERRDIAVRLGAPVERLWLENGEVRGVICGEPIEARRAVILATGGFESSQEMQRQFWSTPPVRAVATFGNTGDGIRMAQQAGAGLWHMWHYHGVYGFHHPDPTFKLGIRIRRMRNWTPGQGSGHQGSSHQNPMSWIIVDQRGRRYMNEYDPYMQDTNHRRMALYDPVTQSYPRIPSVLLLDARGRELYPLCEPIYSDPDTAARFNRLSLREFDEQVLSRRSSLGEIADEFGLDRGMLVATVETWNAACRAGADPEFERPPGSMMPILEPPFSAARVWPIVSNTQGGLPHDEDQRVLDCFGRPIERLYVAGELGSVFGHLYLSGGNYSECLIAGRIAGANAARLEPRRGDGASRSRAQSRDGVSAAAR
jgi:succinate dehydrogenase/fumarate reductase flavoprotein subunit